MIRSILTVAACIVTWGALWVSANFALASLMPARFDESGLTSDPAMLLTLIAICAMLCVGAGWLCAALVERAAMKHVAVLALVQLAIGIGVQASVWDQMPLWYHLTFLGVVAPMHLVGGWVRVGGTQAHSKPTPTVA